MLVLIGFFFQINGCISLTSADVSHHSVRPKENKFHPEEISIFMITEGGTMCITPEQRDMFNSWYNKYFEYNKGEKVNIYLQGKYNASDVQLIVNQILFLASFGIIPLYVSSSLNIDVETSNGNSTKYQSAWLLQEGLASVLALPFMFNNSVAEIKRNNVESGFYRASLMPFKDTGIVEKKGELKPVKDCLGFLNGGDILHRPSQLEL